MCAESDLTLATTPQDLRRDLKDFLDLRVIPARGGPSPAIVALARLAADGAAEAVFERLAALRGAGMSAEELCQDHLTEAARLLGTWWEEDRAGFCEVTLGMLVLRRALSRLAPGLPRGPAGPGRSILIATAPGEQHRFGAAMLAEGFRAAGWLVVEAEAEDAAARARAAGVALAALAAGGRATALALRPLIRALRAGPAPVGVLVGGPAFLKEPALVARLGADGTAPDMAATLRLAEARLGLLAEAA